MTPTYHNLAENLNVSLLFQLSLVKFELEIEYSRVLGLVINVQCRRQVRVAAG
jgi:hypothetical protein